MACILYSILVQHNRPKKGFIATPNKEGERPMTPARLLSKILIATFLIFSAQNLAHAQRYNQPRDLVLEERIYQDFQGQSKIDVQDLFRHRSNQFKGMRIKSLSMKASSSQGRAQTALQINGFSNRGDFQTVGRYNQTIYFPIDSQRNVIGKDIRSLEIYLRGQVYVEEVKMVLEQGQAREVFDYNFSDFFNGAKTYRVREALGLGSRHNGKSLNSVHLTGRSPMGDAEVRLFINDRQVGRAQRLSSYQQEVSFRVPRQRSTLGQDIRSIQLKVNGRSAHITQIKAEVGSRRNGGGYPGRVPNFVEKTVQLHLTGHQNYSLQDLIDRHDLGHARVKTVEVMGRSRNGNGQIQVCEKSYYGQQDCQRAQRLGRAMTRHSFFSGESLEDIEIRSRGQIHLQKIKVTFERY